MTSKHRLHGHLSGAMRLQKESSRVNTADRVAMFHCVCSFTFSNQIVQITRTFFSDGEKLPEVACLPHPEVVQVEPSVTDQRNTPQFVTVNRCKGACHLPLNTESCTPINSRNISVEVTFADGTSQLRYVEEHLECLCQCHKHDKGLNCTEHHVLDEQTCRCICKVGCREDENQNPVSCACTPRAGKRRDEIIDY